MSTAVTYVPPQPPIACVWSYADECWLWWAPWWGQWCRINRPRQTRTPRFIERHLTDAVKAAIDTQRIRTPDRAMPPDEPCNGWSLDVLPDVSFIPSYFRRAL